MNDLHAIRILRTIGEVAFIFCTLAAIGMLVATLTDKTLDFQSAPAVGLLGIVGAFGLFLMGLLTWAVCRVLASMAHSLLMISLYTAHPLDQRPESPPTYNTPTR